MIAAGLHGIDNELPLEAPLEGNAYESDKPHVPQNMYDARDLFARQRGRPRGVRPGGRRPLPEPRRIELEALEATVTDWERVRGFERL